MLGNPVKVHRSGAAALAVRAAALATACGIVLACGGPPPPQLLLLITVDTLRADEIGAYGSRRGLTPHVDALARESLVFEAAYAAAPLTLPSLAAVFTGRHPEELGIRSNESAVPNSVSTLATELSARGWRTGAVVGNFVLRRAAGLARGFELFDDALPDREVVRRWPERTAASASDAALDMLDGCTELAGSRCFLWVHYQDPHGPYHPPSGRRTRWLERGAGAARELPVGGDSHGQGAIPDYQFLAGRRDVAYYLAGYRGEIGYVDEQVGRLLRGVKERGLESGAVVVFLADHGESLGENGVWFAHGTELTDEQVRVPLLIRVPDRRPARRRDPVSLVDLYPTLLVLLAEGGSGLSRSGEPRGRDLLAAGAESERSRLYMSTLGAAPVPRSAIVEDGYKLIVSGGAGEAGVRLHRLGSEEVELAAVEPETAGRLREVLAGLRDRFGTGVPETAQELSPEDRETLRALGYLDAAAGNRGP